MGYYVYEVTPGQSVSEKTILDCIRNVGNDETTLHKPAAGMPYGVIVECKNKPISLLGLGWKEVDASCVASPPPDDDELEEMKHGK